MSASSSPTPPIGRAVFLSYAREDTPQVRRLAEALRGVGVEVWFDQNELVGGDAWDAKIRKQIKECGLFLPIISANTQARREGYFRIEWKLAAQRTHAIADGTPFLLPVAIAAVAEGEALVPEEFRGVQWTRLEADGEYAALGVRVQRLLAGETGGGTRERFKPTRPRGAETLTRSATPRGKLGIGLALGSVLVAAVAFYALRPRPPAPLGGAQVAATPRPVPAPEPGAARPPDLADAKSVAVLAFENRSGDKENEYFSDGISDELLTLLQQTPGLRVASQISAFSFKGKSATAQEIGEKLKVAHLVEGSVQKLGTRVKITARLSRVATGDQIWAYSDTRELEDIFALQNEIAALIAKNLQVQLGTSPRAAKVVNPEAHRLVLEGRHFWNLRTEESLVRAEGSFQKALQIDSQFAEAYAGLAGVLVVRANFDQLDGLGDGVEDLRKARAAATRAIELDASLVEAHASIGFAATLERRFAEAARSFQRALALNPNSALTHCWFGLYQNTQGRFDLSTNEFRQAALLDPLGFIIVQMVASNAFATGQFEDAWAANERAASLLPGAYGANRGYAVAIAHELGRKEDVIEIARGLRRTATRTPHWWSDAYVVYALRGSGHPAEAEEHARWVMERLRPESYIRGWLLTALGRFDEGLPFLGRTPTLAGANICNHPMWDRWREDPRFQQLLGQLGDGEQHKIGRETIARMKSSAAGRK